MRHIKMPAMFFRVFGYLISAWAIVAVWSEDAMGQRNAPVYWTLIALLALTVLILEIRDLVKSSAK